VHGAGGTLGAILTGIFAVSVINPAFGADASGRPLPTGVLDGHWMQVLNQLAAARRRRLRFQFLMRPYAILMRPVASRATRPVRLTNRGNVQWSKLRQ
jgi:hypothetical protein